MFRTNLLHSSITGHQLLKPAYLFLLDQIPSSPILISLTPSLNLFAIPTALQKETFTAPQRLSSIIRMPPWAPEASLKLLLLVVQASDFKPTQSWPAIAEAMGEGYTRESVR